MKAMLITVSGACGLALTADALKNAIIVKQRVPGGRYDQVELADDTWLGAVGDGTWTPEGDSPHSQYGELLAVEVENIDGAQEDWEYGDYTPLDKFVPYSWMEKNK